MKSSRPSSNQVVFYVNGPPRLLLAALIAAELYPAHSCSVILLKQFGYDYSALLPYVADHFDEIHQLSITTRRYSHLDQFLKTYFARYNRLRGWVPEQAEMVLFGLRSPVEKFLIRHSRSLGNRVSVYAGSLDIERYFEGWAGDSWLRGVMRRCFARAFDYQHDYDDFFVLEPELYRASPLFGRLSKLPDLYSSPTLRRIGDRAQLDLGLNELIGAPLVFFGQPVSGSDSLLTQKQEESLLQRIFAGRTAVVLPHPNELPPASGEADKYSGLVGARVIRSGLPNELLLRCFRPQQAATYFSTIGVTFALRNPQVPVHFYPLRIKQLRSLERYRLLLPNMVLHDDHVGYGQ